MVVDMEADMVADREVNKVAGKVTDMVAAMVADEKEKRGKQKKKKGACKIEENRVMHKAEKIQFGERVGHIG